jgi:O-antigen ligase
VHSTAAHLLDRAIFVGFLTALAGAPLVYGSDNQPAIELLTVALVALSILWGLLAVVQKEMSFVWSPVHTALVAFLGVALIQLVPQPIALRAVGIDGALVGGEPGPLGWNVITLDRTATTDAAAKLAVLIGYFFIASAFINSAKRARVTVTVLFIAGFVVSLIGIINALAPESAILWKFPSGSVAFGPFVNRAHFSGFAEMTLPLGLAMIVTGSVEKDRRLLVAFMTVLIGCAVFMSASRAGMIIVLLEVLFLPLVGFVIGRPLMQPQMGRLRPAFHGSQAGRLRHVFRGAIGALLLAGAILAGVAWIGNDPVIRRISSRFESERSTMVRPEIWRATLKMIGDNPIFGVGLGAFAVAYPRYDRWNGLSTTAEAHNDYLQVLSDTGAIGGLVGVFFLLALLRVVRRALGCESSGERVIALGAGVGCAAMLVHSLADFNLQITSNALVFLTLVALLIRAQLSDRVCLKQL